MTPSPENTGGIIGAAGVRLLDAILGAAVTPNGMRAAQASNSTIPHTPRAVPAGTGTCPFPDPTLAYFFFAASLSAFWSHWQIHSGALHALQIVVSYCIRAVTDLALGLSLNCRMSHSPFFTAGTTK